MSMLAPVISPELVARMEHAHKAHVATTEYGQRVFQAEWLRHHGRKSLHTPIVGPIEPLIQMGPVITPSGK